MNERAMEELLAEALRAEPMPGLGERRLEALDARRRMLARSGRGRTAKVLLDAAGIVILLGGIGFLASRNWRPSNAPRAIQESRVSTQRGLGLSNGATREYANRAVPDASVFNDPEDFGPGGFVSNPILTNVIIEVQGPLGGPGPNQYYVGSTTERASCLAPPVDEIELEDVYEPSVENDFRSAREEPVSTFSIDVDTASYSTARQALEQGTLPDPASVRIEELVNYFDYGVSAPVSNAPFSVDTEVAGCPWNEEHRLVRIGIRGADLMGGSLPPCNLVFLLDVSGSMSSRDKLPLVKRALGLLVDNLRPEDRVGIVVYAGAAGVVLPPTSGFDKDTIRGALESLAAGGSTAGGEGIELAYALAEEHFTSNGVNRVVLATDGDFNVGVRSRSELEELIAEKATGGVFLTVLGFGVRTGGDRVMETLADRGNGNYAYIDSLHEAQRVLVDEVGGTLVALAKDVKVQAEFDPERVESYRLIGYENRRLENREFRDDRRDAGDLGASHSVAALYEYLPKGPHAGSPLTVRMRFKLPTEEVSSELEFPVTDGGYGYWDADADTRFAAAVAGFGMLLRESSYCGELTFEDVALMAGNSLGWDDDGRREAFVELVKRAQELR